LGEIFFGILPVFILLLIFFSKAGFSYSIVFKISILIFSYLCFTGILSLLFSKGLFMRSLLTAYKDGYENKIKHKFLLSRKLFVQILPMIIVAIFITGLIGYGGLLKDRGDLLFRLYKNRLQNSFEEAKISNVHSIEKIMNGFEFENSQDSYYIIDSKGHIYNNYNLSKMFLYYVSNDKDYKGHAYSEVVEEQGSSISIKSNNKIWTIGIRYVVVSPSIILYIFISFLLLSLILMLVLFFVSKSLSNDIAAVAESLEIIADRNNNDLGNLVSVTSNDEIGRLVVAYNSVQKRFKSHIEEIERQEEISREKDKMIAMQSRHASMGEMLANIAHQWRQPLNAVGVLVQNVEMRYDQDVLTKKEFKEKVTQVMEQVLYMSQTIDDFRNFFRPDKEKSEFSIKKAIDVVMKIIGGTLKNNGIEINIKGEDIRITGFPNEYNQVLLNLLSNAKDAMIERKIKSPSINITLFQEKKKAVVTVSDNAGGIKPNLLHKIFDPYFSTKEFGTGIGLYMSKMIIEKNMGGILSVKNIEKGAEFRIEVGKKAST
jgi:signal transduction histidine kinase